MLQQYGRPAHVLACGGSSRHRHAGDRGRFDRWIAHRSARTAAPSSRPSTAPVLRVRSAAYRPRSGRRGHHCCTPRWLSDPRCRRPATGSGARITARRLRSIAINAVPTSPLARNSCHRGADAVTMTAVTPGLSRTSAYEYHLHRRVGSRLGDQMVLWQEAFASDCTGFTETEISTP